MADRDLFLLSLRPVIAGAKIHNQMSPEERFQNQTLRPVIKLQHELLISSFQNYVRKHKNVFYELTTERRIDYIENAIHKDMKFRNALKGIILGMFTQDEFYGYTQNSSAINKRMMNLVKERFISNLQILEQEPKVVKIA